MACYDAECGGYFKPHRDNDGDGHRQFAVTINLNADVNKINGVVITGDGSTTPFDV